MAQIKQGQKVKVSFATEDSEKEFDCSIKDVYTDRLVLNYPQELLKYGDYLSEGDEIPVKIFTPLGIKLFDAVVLDSPAESGAFVVEYIEEQSTGIQRREYVRVPLVLKIFIETEIKKNIIANTIDISGGGLKFISPESFVPKEEVKVTIYIPEDRSVQAKGIIVQNDYIPQNQHVMSFTDIEEKDRDRIIKKCFEVQLTSQK